MDCQKSQAPHLSEVRHFDYPRAGVVYGMQGSREELECAGAEREGFGNTVVRIADDNRDSVADADYFGNSVIIRHGQIGVRPMVTVFRTAGLALTAVLIAKLIRRYTEEQALLLTLLAGIGITAAGVLAMTPIFNEIDNLLAKGGLTPEQTACIAKAAGICCVTQLASDVCKDAGESAIASAVMLSGKIALILLILPLFHPLLTRLEEVLSCVSAFG